MVETTYRVVGPRGVIHELEASDVQSRMKSGAITPATLIARAGTEDFASAASYEELALFFDDAPESATAVEQTTVSSARLITYLALAGLTGAMLMGILGPLCLMIGPFARFLLTTAAFGAVLGLGINSAVRENDPRIINLSAAGFTAGGVVAWLLRSSADFTPFHLAIIGLGGGIGLAYALRLPLRSAIPLTLAAIVLFPLSVIFNPVQPGSDLSFNIPILLAPLALLVMMVIPAIPFSIFGGLLGFILSRTRHIDA